MLTKEECLKALCRIQCRTRPNKKCEECECFDNKVNIWKCVENTKESFIIRQLIEEHFENLPLKFEELKVGMFVWDNKMKDYYKIYEINHENKNLNLTGWHIGNHRFEENRYYRKQVLDE